MRRGLILSLFAFILVTSVFAISSVLAYYNNPENSGDNQDQIGSAYTNKSSNNDSGDNEDKNKSEFCGTSTKGYCQINDDCKKGGCSSQVCENKSESSSIVTTCEYLDCYNAEKYNKKCGCEENKCKWISNKDKELKRGNLTKEQIKEAIHEKNRIKFEERTRQKCLDGCVCTGVVMKCELEDGTRQMTVYAQSGNIIIVTKSVNASATVELYKSNKTLIGLFKNNETKEIKITPEQIKEKIGEKYNAKLQDEEIQLNENGYKYKAKKYAKLFGLFPIKEKVEWEIDPETGLIRRTKTSWWGFLAKDEKQQLVSGASCGTVTPGMNDKCCQNKGYDKWNSETEECVFSDNTN